MQPDTASPQNIQKTTQLTNTTKKPSNRYNAWSAKSLALNAYSGPHGWLNLSEDFISMTDDNNQVLFNLNLSSISEVKFFSGGFRIKTSDKISPTILLYDPSSVRNRIGITALFGGAAGQISAISALDKMEEQKQVNAAIQTFFSDHSIKTTGKVSMGKSLNLIKASTIIAFVALIALMAFVFLSNRQ